MKTNALSTIACFTVVAAVAPNQNRPFPTMEVITWHHRGRHGVPIVSGSFLCFPFVLAVHVKATTQYPSVKSSLYCHRPHRSKIVVHGVSCVQEKESDQITSCARANVPTNISNEVG